jgi:hypothetical protein
MYSQMEYRAHWETSQFQIRACITSPSLIPNAPLKIVLRPWMASANIPLQDLLAHTLT